MIHKIYITLGLNPLICDFIVNTSILLAAIFTIAFVILRKYGPAIAYLNEIEEM